MATSKKNPLQTKNDLPVFQSDEVFLRAFEKNSEPEAGQKKTIDCKNRDEKSVNEESDESLEQEDFAAMLEASFKTQRLKPLTKNRPLSLKQTIKRYPGVELDLDLHGYYAIDAQLELRSFIQSCRHQGYFTVRIIVGKGLHSENGAVLPDIVEDELKKMLKQNLVIFYKWERKKKETSGAVIVYLKHFEKYD